MPKGFTDREKELIRQRLIRQGHKLFSAHGLKKTNIDELAEAAGISKGAFYLFYASKEALFMDIAELAEQRYRQEMMAAVDRPGPTPRARLLAVFQMALALLKTTPILQFFTGSDYDLLFRRLPPEKLQEHLANDRLFFQALITRCQAAGIPIRAQPDEISSLLYPLVLTVWHEDDSVSSNFSGRLDVLLELVAAFCLGEVETQAQATIAAAPSRNEDTHHEPGD